MFDSEYLDGPRRERVRVRLLRFVTEAIERELAPLFAAEVAAADHPALRGPVHRVVEAGGVLPGATEGAVPAALRGPLKQLGLRAGRFALFLPALLKPQPAARAGRAAGRCVPACPRRRCRRPGSVSIAPPTDWPPGFAAALGWVAAGRR